MRSAVRARSHDGASSSAACAARSAAPSSVPPSSGRRRGRRRPGGGARDDDGGALRRRGGGGLLRFEELLEPLLRLLLALGEARLDLGHLGERLRVVRLRREHGLEVVVGVVDRVQARVAERAAEERLDVRRLDREAARAVVARALVLLQLHVAEREVRVVRRLQLAQLLELVGARGRAEPRHHRRPEALVRLGHARPAAPLGESRRPQVARVVRRERRAVVARQELLVALGLERACALDVGCW